MALGFDVGTYNLVCCKRNDNGDFVYKREVNAFLSMPLENDFVFNMMKQAGVPLIHREDAKVAYALGEASVNMAYTMTQLELKRPMKDGCVNPKEQDAFQIMNIMIHSLLDEVENDREILCYCVPANAINEETDADYHQKIVEAIFKAYKSDKGFTVDARPINEGMALVYAELKDKMFTGIGVSCLCPETKIYTNNGIVEIQNVKQGDKVITHTGRWGEINKVIKKDFKGVMTKIQIAGYSNNTEEYKFVDNHELYVKRNGCWNWVGCEEIKVGDIVGEPILKQNRDATRPSINICERITNSKEWMKKKIESTPDLQRFMGYFLGDGSINQSEGCIQIDFGANEVEYAQDVVTILNSRFDKNATETSKGSDSVIRVKCYSRGLVNWMSNNCYNKNGEKQYPWSLDRLTNSECLNLLCGMVRSDGTISEEQVTFGNTNTNLILLAKQLFSRIGLASSLSWREPREHLFEKENRIIRGQKNEWTVSSAGKKVCTSLVEQLNNLCCENSQTRESIFIEDGFCCGRVQAIEHEEYEGEVYDLQVPGDHSFSGPFLTIHNCGAGMVNVAFSLFGAPVFTFAIVNSGDWIDKQSAHATGETIAFINKEKTKIDLNKEPNNLIERAIMTQYQLMIEKTVFQIKKGLENNKDKNAKLDAPVDFVVAGGTASPPGFDKLFEKLLREAKLPIEVGRVIRPADPIYSVAKGCLVAAENAK
jgi:hypothetical protein